MQKLPTVKIPESLPLKAFSQRYGLSEDAVRGKIKSLKWIEGREWFYDPDNKIHVIIPGYQQWKISKSPVTIKRIMSGYFE